VFHERAALIPPLTIFVFACFARRVSTTALSCWFCHHPGRAGSPGCPELPPLVDRCSGSFDCGTSHWRRPTSGAPTQRPRGATGVHLVSLQQTRLLLWTRTAGTSLVLMAGGLDWGCGPCGFVNTSSAMLFTADLVGLLSLLSFCQVGRYPRQFSPPRLGRCVALSAPRLLLATRCAVAPPAPAWTQCFAAGCRYRGLGCLGSASLP